MIEILWSLWLYDGGLLQWLPGDLLKLPEVCAACGAPLAASAYEAGTNNPIELTCHRGHRWLSTTAELKRRTERRAE